MSHLNQVVDFLRSIGLEANMVGSTAGFVPGVELRGGTLLLQPDALVADVLHEAGHIAVLPSRVRPAASGNISKAQKAAVESIDWNTCDPDSLESRAAMQCGDPEATAWAWAAGVHLGLDPLDIIDDASYDGSGATIRLMLAKNSYMGINGLSHAGFCVARPGPLAEAKGLPAFPSLGKWLQD